MGSPTGADDIADARSVELPARPPAGDTTHEDGAETTGRSPPAPSPYGVAPIAVIIIFSCLATVSYRNTSRASLYRALEWMSQNLILGRAIFLVVYVLCMALMLPGSVLAVLAGAYRPQASCQASKVGSAARLCLQLQRVIGCSGEARHLAHLHA